MGNSDVDVIIPGMLSVAEVEENVAIASGSSTLNPEERRRLERDRAELGTHVCRGCDYCQPCPQGIPISWVLRWELFEKRIGWIPRFPQFRDGVAKAATCLKCGECESRCPYHLPIQTLLPVYAASLEDQLASYN